MLGQHNLHAISGLKNQVSALLTVIAGSVYVAGGLIAWRKALLMMGAALIGGYAGARVSKRLPTLWLRRGIVMTGFSMTVAFFAR